MAFLSLKARLAEEASLKKEADAYASTNQGAGARGDWSRTLTSWCGETTFVQYGGNPPPTLGADMTIDEYVEIPGVDDIMTKVRAPYACVLPPPALKFIFSYFRPSLLLRLFSSKHCWISCFSRLEASHFLRCRIIHTYIHTYAPPSCMCDFFIT